MALGDAVADDSAGGRYEVEEQLGAGGMGVVCVGCTGGYGGIYCFAL